MKLQKYISALLDGLIVASLLFFFSSFGFRDGRSSGWYQQWFPNLNGSNITSMTFLDSLTGYAATNTNSLIQGYILRTTNGGDNWNIIYTYVPPSVNSGFTKIQFVNNSVGFASTNYFDFFKTINGGNNWIQISTPDGADDMSVINTDTILIVSSDGFAGGVFRTTNGGLSWQALGPTGGSGQPGSIYMFNKNMGFNLSSVGMKKTTNGGVNWFGIPGENYSGIQFVDSLRGWKTAGAGIKISTNGGLNWSAQQLPNINHGYNGTNLYAINRDTVWMIGNDYYFGILYKTTNGGNNWGYQFADTSVHITLNRFINFFDNKTGWASSPYYNSEIHTKVGGSDTTFLTSINNNISRIPEKYILEQNYPNPFNSKSKIKYKITKSSNIKIKISDIRGKELKTLIDKQQNQGEYEITFNGENLSSGIYFYTLFANGMKIDTKKMLLIK